MMKKMMGIVALSMMLFACGGNKNEEATDTTATVVEEVVAPELQMGEYKATFPMADKGTAEEATLVIKEGNLCDYKTSTEDLKDVPYTFAEGKLAFADKAFEVENGMIYMLDQDGKRANVEGSEEYIFKLAPAEVPAEAPAEAAPPK